MPRLTPCSELLLGRGVALCRRAGSVWRAVWRSVRGRSSVGCVSVAVQYRTTDTDCTVPCVYVARISSMADKGKKKNMLSAIELHVVSSAAVAAAEATPLTERRNEDGSMCGRMRAARTHARARAILPAPIATSHARHRLRGCFPAHALLPRAAVQGCVRRSHTCPAIRVRRAWLLCLERVLHCRGGGDVQRRHRRATGDSGHAQ
eukprot:COSAG02_NODE_210_length_28878_cov_133.787136_11_plen_205_part_00